MNIDVLVSNIEKFVLLGPYDINTAISLIENTMFLMDIPYSDITGSVCVFDNEQKRTVDNKTIFMRLLFRTRRHRFSMVTTLVTTLY